MTGSADAGFAEALGLAEDFAATLEHDPPQPETCAF